MTNDDRFTFGLVFDIFGVLERHGYHQSDNRHTGQALVAIYHLAYAYDGTQEPQYGSYLDQAPPAAHAEAQRPDAEPDDAIILSDAEVSTVVTALGTAADYQRDRSASCTRCSNQSCPTCQSRLRDAQTYQQMAAQMLHTAEIARATNASEPEPDGPPPRSRQPHPAADKEAGH